MHSFAVISRCLLSFFKIWLLYLFSSIFAQAPCYYPGGDLQTADTPCNSLPKGFFSDFRDYRCIATTSNPSTCSIQSITQTDSNKITISSSTISSSTMRISATNSPSPNPSLLQTCQTNSPLPTRPPENSATIQIGIGAGIGIPLLLGLVASLLFLFRERRIRKQLAIECERSNERG